MKGQGHLRRLIHSFGSLYLYFPSKIKINNENRFQETDFPPLNKTFFYLKRRDGVFLYFYRFRSI